MRLHGEVRCVLFVACVRLTRGWQQRFVGLERVNGKRVGRTAGGRSDTRTCSRRDSCGRERGTGGTSLGQCVFCGISSCERGSLLGEGSICRLRIVGARFQGPHMHR